MNLIGICVKRKRKKKKKGKRKKLAYDLEVHHARRPFPYKSKQYYCLE